MISNQILQNTIEGLKGITRVELSVIDVDGKVLASTFKETINYHEAAESFTKAGMKHVEVKLYPQDRHEILNETDRDTVWADILAWLKARI